jgi:ubiquinone/menaquinone biosynthesis C-methylase UbiE
MLADSIKLRRVVRDLGDDNPALAGISSPGYSSEELNRHIHALFQDNYQDYMRPFPLTRGGIDHWKGLIADAMPASHADYQRRLSILDIGSGEGTSVFPLIELFPNADIVASDLSLNLLRELGQWHRQHYADRPLPLLQLNAQDTVFEDAQLDLVTGAHVLHHLGDLRGTFVEIHRILKPGGIALFWEPFESGCQIVSLIMQLLIAKNETTSEDDRLSHDVVAGFREYIFDLHRRKGSSKSQALLDTIDDKWIFTRTQLEALVDGTGLELTAVRQVASPDGLIVNSVDLELARRLQSLERLPQWARDLVHQIEAQFSREYISELLFSGVIVLTRPRVASSPRFGANSGPNKADRYVYQPAAAPLTFSEAMRKLTERGYTTVTGPVNMTEPRTVSEVRRMAPDSGIVFADYAIDPDGFRKYVAAAGYRTQYAQYYQGNQVEKSLEHFIALELLQVASGDVFIDIASEHSPFAEIAARLTGATTFSQDIMYPEGVIGSRIGGDACSMPVPDRFASKACLTCSLEHFEGNGDARLFLELGRMLRPGGAVCIVPFYVNTQAATQTDPIVSVAVDVPFDAGVPIHCAEGWGNRHGRFYSPQSFANRIAKPFRDKFKFDFFCLSNAAEIDPTVYARFALVATRLVS